MKRIISIVLVLIIVLSLCLVSCVNDSGQTTTNNTNPTSTSTSTTTKAPDPDSTPDPDYDPNAPEGDRILRKMIMNEEKHLLVYNKTESLSFEELVLAQAIQGIYARTSARYYQWEAGSYEFWLEDMVENYGYTYECVTLEQMVKSYIEDYSKYYVLYDRATLAESTNSACSIAGVTGYLPVDKSIKIKVQNWGLKMKIDASKMTEETCFSLYKDRFNTDGIVQQDPNNSAIRDWAIACKYFVFFQKGQGEEQLSFREEVHNWLDNEAAVYGWVPNDELKDVKFASEHSQFVFPSDHSKNTTIFACEGAFGDLDFTQNAKETDVKAEKGKHYVCIVMSDGDNVQMWYNRSSFTENPIYFGAERDNSFPMGWSVQPALIDLGPNILYDLKREAGEKDYFVAAISGVGYIYPEFYATLDDYTEKLGAYLKATDLSVVQLYDWEYNPDSVTTYAQIEELDGAIYFIGNKYVEGNGSVYWSNGKPFVTVRETMWSANVMEMALRINSYSKDPTTIEGYTVINVHPWSMNYQDVVKLVSLLNDDVVVVTADDLIRLVTENVPHEDVVR